jgi:hypothetical protein
MTKLRYLGMVLLAVALSFTGPAVSGVHAQNGGAPLNGISVPITGSGTGATFSGVLNVTRFVLSGNQIMAVGTITGTLTNTVTNTTSTVIRQVQLPVDLLQTTGTCEILHLVLGPLDLDLLGLQVHLNQVVLDIQAQSGPGNLLGNLLCAVANLLNSSGALQQLTALLNQILGALG